jgi:hypothetical protein
VKYAPDIFVGVDQAAVSGWCIHAQGSVHAHGITRNALEIVAVVESVRALAKDELGRVLVVLEEHGTHQHNATKKHQRSHTTLLGMGEARGWWVQEFARYGHPELLRLRVTSEDWRIRVLGVRNSLGTERLKEVAKQWAAGRARHALEDDNEAEAIALASWAALDGLSRLEAQRTQARIKALGKRNAKKQLELLKGA